MDQPIAESKVVGWLGGWLMPPLSVWEAFLDISISWFRWSAVDRPTEKGMGVGRREVRASVRPSETFHSHIPNVCELLTIMATNITIYKVQARAIHWYHICRSDEVLLKKGVAQFENLTNPIKLIPWIKGKSVNIVIMVNELEDDICTLSRS